MAERRERKRKRQPRPLGTAALIAGVVVLAVAVAPGTLSYFQGAADTAPVSVSSGSAGLQIVRTAGQIPSAVYPGGPAALLDATTPATVTNAGTVPLAVSAALSGPGATPANFAGSVVISVLFQTGAACPAAPPAGTPSGAVGAASGTLATLAVGATQTVCLWQSLPATAPAGTMNQAANLTLTLTGTQQGP